jgi:amino acid adenylation domain-containing protein
VGVHRPFPPEEIEQSIPARFAAQVRAFPERLAVKMGDDVLSYAELDRHANRIARALLAERVNTPEPVALVVEQSPTLIATILGVLKAGKIYVPLDPTHPLPRLEEALAHAQVGLVVADASHRALAVSLARCERTVLDVSRLDGGLSDQDPALALGPDLLAYVFFTSGSTGRPKGVFDCHRNVLHNIMRYTNNLRIGPDDRLTLLQAPSFSGTVSSLFGALLNGAAIFPYDLRRQGMGPALARWLRTERVSIYHSVPTIFRSAVEGGDRFPDVRVVRLEGDAASPVDVKLFRACFEPGSLLAVGLGATETGLSCQFLIDHETSLSAGPVPIGRPTPDMRISVLDAEGHPLPAGNAGELAVTSAHLALGYWNEPELTARAFVANADGTRTYRTGDLGRIRSDGLVEYLGRKDYRLKVGGQTIDAAEVEAALLALEGIRAAAVTTHATATGDARLCAYVVLDEPSRRRAALDLRRRLQRTLPAHMVPSTFVPVTDLPVSEHGKLDRRALQPPAASPRAPRGPLIERLDLVEAMLVEAWETVTGVEGLGIHDDFHDLGGDSLMAARIAAAIDASLGRTVPVDAIGRFRTIESLAAALRGGLGLPVGCSPVTIQAGAGLRPFFFVDVPWSNPFRYGEIGRAIGSERPLHVLRPFVAADYADPTACMESIAASRAADLRAMQPDGPYALGGWCYGAVVALEMGRQLRAAGQEVSLLALCGITAHDFPTLVSPMSRWRYRCYRWSKDLGRPLRHAHRTAKMHGGRLRRLEPKGWPAYLGRMLVEVAPSRREQEALERRVFRRHAPAPYPGDVLLVLGGNDTRRYAVEAGAAWRGLARGRVVIAELAGCSLDRPEGAALSAVGAELKKALSRLEATRS